MTTPVFQPRLLNVTQSPRPAPMTAAEQQWNETRLKVTIVFFYVVAPAVTLGLAGYLAWRILR